VKILVIIAVAVVLLIPFSAFAQEESLSELDARLDAENLQKAEEAGSIVDPSGSNIQQQEMINEVTGEALETDNQIIWLFVIIAFIIMGFVILKKRSLSSEGKSSD